MKQSKRYTKIQKSIDRNRLYGLKEAFEVIESAPKAKFDESVDVAVRLGVDPKQADQMVRGTAQLPHGTGKTVRVVVIAKGDKAKEAEAAGADVVGDKEVADKIQAGWFDFDTLIATPDMMGVVGKLGSLLGPRGLMPNPKSGTVTQDVGRAVKEVKGGRIEFRVDKGANVHAIVGKASFSPSHLAENTQAFVEALLKAKPSTSKGVYIKAVCVSTTMGPGIKLDPSQVV